MYSKETITAQFSQLGIDPAGTLLIHSSFKSIGSVEGGPEGFLDCIISYMRNGLLLFPTHTWDHYCNKNNLFDPSTEPGCVGILSNLFMKRPGVLRSLHPTHSLAALGNGAAEYIIGEENLETPCPRRGCWGRLYDQNCQILFIGCGLKKNTFLHSVEEWMQVPERLALLPTNYKIRVSEDLIISSKLYRHFNKAGDISQNYDKIESRLIADGIAKRGKVGHSDAILCKAKEMADLACSILSKQIQYFDFGCNDR